MSFSTCIREMDGVSVIDLVGRVVLGEGARETRAVISQVLNDGQKKVVVNMSLVEYMDSCGLGELVSAYASSMRLGGEIKLANMQPRVAGLMQVTKLATLFASYPDEMTAVRSFS
jgi:anti-sigma B factor antagonist